MDSSRSQFTELLLCHRKKKEREEEAKGPFECERTSEKRERQKRGEKSWDLTA